jgi:hypothetical protein
VTYPLLPDAEAELVAWLTAHPTLAPLHGGYVGTRLETDQPCLQVTALGGPQPWPWEQSPEFSIQSWGGEKADASLLDRTVRSVVWELVGTAIAGGHVVGVSVRLGSLWAPDDTTGRARYRMDISLMVLPS